MILIIFIRINTKSLIASTSISFDEKYNKIKLNIKMQNDYNYLKMKHLIKVLIVKGNFYMDFS